MTLGNLLLTQVNVTAVDAKVYSLPLITIVSLPGVLIVAKRGAHKRYITKRKLLVTQVIKGLQYYTLYYLHAM